MSHVPPPGDRHGINSFAHYISIHNNVMRGLADERIVVANNLRVDAVGPNHFRFFGKILLRGGIYIAVNKWLARASTRADVDRVPKKIPNAPPTEVPSGKIFVITRRYSYSGVVYGHHSFIRYDNVDHHMRTYPRVHLDEYHRHHIDWRNNQEQGIPVWVGRAQWPLLGEFIREVEAWRIANEAVLPVPPPKLRVDDLEDVSDEAPEDVFEESGADSSADE